MIVATAGHVDHGKTSLVRNLTGVETDRLEEEKRRGLTINLGYAFLAVTREQQPQGHIGFIDVPGHSRFINTMISGISGIDLGLLVIAANDGPMPQTIEHIQVMRLLGVKNYAVAITHVDTVDLAQLDSVSQSISALLEREGCQAEAPVFPVDNLSGAGIPALKAYLESLAAEPKKNPSSTGYFRLSIDRSFHLKGSGLIVTGTALSGRVAPEDNLVLLPQHTALRVRSLHANNEAATIATAGQRCALNIVGDISKAQLERGDWLVSAGAGASTRRVDTRIRLLAGAPFGLKHLSPVKVYIGAARLSARLSLLEKGEGNSRIKPGEQQFAQLILEREISCCHADRFLLRDDSESVLLGGGEVLDPWGPRTGKYKAERLSLLGALEEGSFTGALEKLLFEQQHIVDLTHLAQARNLSPEEARDALSKSAYFDRVISWQAKGIDYCAAREQYSAAQALLLQSLSEWHRDHPQEKGMPAKLGSGALPKKQRALLVPVTTGLISQGKIKLANGLLSRSDHRVTLPSGEVRAWMRVETALKKHGKAVPSLGDLGTELQLPPKTLLATLKAAAAAGQLDQISDKRFALPSQMQDFANSVTQLGRENTEFSVIEYRDLVKIGRNQAVELLEYFDRVKFTRRNGNQRVVVDADFPDRYVSLPDA